MCVGPARERSRPVHRRSQGFASHVRTCYLILRLNPATALRVSGIKCTRRVARDRHPGLLVGRPSIPEFPAPTSAFWNKEAFVRRPQGHTTPAVHRATGNLQQPSRTFPFTTAHVQSGLPPAPASTSCRSPKSYFSTPVSPLNCTRRRSHSGILYRRVRVRSPRGMAILVAHRGHPLPPLQSHIGGSAVRRLPGVHAPGFHRGGLFRHGTDQQEDLRCCWLRLNPATPFRIRDKCTDW